MEKPNTLFCMMCDRECTGKVPHMGFGVTHGEAEPVTKALCCACLAKLGLQISRWRHDGTWDRVLTAAGVKGRIIVPTGGPIVKAGE